MERRVLVRGLGLDVCGAAYLLRVTREDKVKVLRGEAFSEDLADPNVVCIDVGGSGQIQLNNWDFGGEHESVAMQVWLEGPPEARTIEWYAREKWGFPKIGQFYPLQALVNYIMAFRINPSFTFSVEFPKLTDLFSGILLYERDPVKQFRRGVDLLRLVVAHDMNPFKSFKGVQMFTGYTEAKAAAD